MRARKLLLHSHEIRKLIGKTIERGMTLVPLRMYFKNGRVKVALALAKGKQAHDKRDAIKKREVDRETRAAVKGTGDDDARGAKRVLVTGARGQLAGAIVEAYTGSAEVLAYGARRARHLGFRRGDGAGAGRPAGRHHQLRCLQPTSIGAEEEPDRR